MADGLGLLVDDSGHKPVEAIPWSELKAFAYGWDKKTTDSGWALVGKQCGFWDMFNAEGAPELTRLICEWDRNWLNVLDRSRRPIATRRTMTLSTGDPL